MSRNVLPEDIKKVLLVLAVNLAPPSPALDIEGIGEEIIRGSSRLIGEFPKLFRWGFFMGIRLFEYIPFFFGYGPKRFTNLKPALQMRYVNSWASCRVIPLREFFKTIKAMVLMVYFSDKRVWAYIGYDPTPHLQERMALRGEVLKKYNIPDKYSV